jgi:hypothetical protein
VMLFAERPLLLPGAAPGEQEHSASNLVPSVRIERTTYRLPYHFGFRRLSFVVWTIP